MANLIARQTNQALTRWIEEQIRIAKVVANDPRVIDACLYPLDDRIRARTQEFLSEVHKLYPYNENIPIAIKQPDDKTFTLDVNGEKKIIKNGTFFIDTVDGKTIGKCGPHFSYIRNILEGKPYFISEVYPSILRGNPIFVVSAPVKKDGELIGIAVIAPRMDYFTESFLKDSRIGTTGHLIMIDDRGMIISHPKRELILSQEAMQNLKPIMDDVRGGKSHFLERLDGSLKSYAVAKFTSKDFHLMYDWYIVCSRNYDEIISDAYSLFKFILVSVLVIGIFVALVTIILTNRIITRPLGRLIKATKRVAEGDLKEKIGPEKRRDEIGVLSKAINDMTASLRAQTVKIREAVNTLDSSATEIAATSKEEESVVAGYEKTTLQVAAAVNEISATSQELAQAMQGVQEVSSEAVTLADRGRSGLAGMEKTMGQLAGATTSFSSKLATINENANKINSVVTTITKVAEQTNLLSFNASIEAEKAGEYGLGFSVVAREIRRLADQTAVATLDIDRMVNEMQSSVSSGVMEMDRFTEEVKKGVKSADEISHQLAEIIEHVKELAPRFEMVNEGMRSQSEGAQHISDAMVQLQDGAKKTSESLGQFNEATEYLRQGAHDLQTEISRFKS
ncbi:MAG: methyl-accepting chemotaxis protein [Thermodesulfobacteriota bacterium]|nr:methyl-accepting chemotaxis protein [Thermodesulfobacteriota bacterium]